jgi:hypothetical protein
MGANPSRQRSSRKLHEQLPSDEIAEAIGMTGMRKVAKQFGVGGRHFRRIVKSKAAPEGCPSLASSANRG